MGFLFALLSTLPGVIGTYFKSKSDTAVAQAQTAATISTNETKSQLSYVNKPFTLLPSSSFTFDRNINDDIRSLLSDLIIEIDRKSTEASSFMLI